MVVSFSRTEVLYFAISNPDLISSSEDQWISISICLGLCLHHHLVFPTPLIILFSFFWKSCRSLKCTDFFLPWIWTVPFLAILMSFVGYCCHLGEQTEKLFLCSCGMDETSWTLNSLAASSAECCKFNSLVFLSNLCLILKAHHKRSYKSEWFHSDWWQIIIFLLILYRIFVTEIWSTMRVCLLVPVSSCKLQLFWLANHFLLYLQLNCNYMAITLLFS